MAALLCVDAQDEVVELGAGMNPNPDEAVNGDRIRYVWCESSHRTNHLGEWQCIFRIATHKKCNKTFVPSISDMTWFSSVENSGISE